MNNTLVKLGGNISEINGLWINKDFIFAPDYSDECSSTELFELKGAGNEFLILDSEVKAQFKNLVKFLPKANETRYYLQGIYFDRSLGRMVACDGHRILTASCYPDFNSNVIIKTGFIKLLLRLDVWDCRKLYLHDDNLVVCLDDGVLKSETISSGVYPDYNRVLHQNSKKVKQGFFELPTDTPKELRHTAKLCKITDSKFAKYQGVKLNSVIEFNEKIRVGYKYQNIDDKKPFEIAVQLKYLLDFPVMDGAKFTVYDDSSPINFENDSCYEGCVMPMKMK